MTFITGVAIVGGILTVLNWVGNAINLGIYASTILPFITSIPEYLGNFITIIGNFLPVYVVAPFFAMLGVLVCYLICHLFSQFINDIG